ncbi:MAG: hypothetical protein IJP17_02400 [Clostridia bacterium]|nr:hypothetical protein [Clostridia bacterium]
MNAAARITKSRIIAFTILSIIPVAAVVLGVILLTHDFLINRSFVLGFIIIPVCEILLLALVSFSGKRRLVKVISAGLILVLFTLAFLAVNAMGKFEQLSRYENEDVKSHYVENDNIPMPSLSDIAQPIEMHLYDYFSQFTIFFSCDVDILICKYDEDAYESQKALLDESYVFQSNSMNARGYACEPTAEINGYLFRALSIDEYELNYPKNIVLIATNDDENEIVYMNFCDDDLDYIEVLDEFINDECGWKHIR